MYPAARRVEKATGSARLESIGHTEEIYLSAGCRKRHAMQGRLWQKVLIVVVAAVCTAVPSPSW